ncbi:glycosyltransferase [Tundrisphaera sp. TA3]|uniref:glycosyltransferase n=1 Tax=Tundrisphaera sp. TA3 TaxID=3435775 RepID=UPI003EBE2D05
MTPPAPPARSVDRCIHRRRIATAPGADLAHCGVVARIMGLAADATGPVGRDACEACCRSLAAGDDLNPVVASLVHEAAGAILRAGGVPGCDASRARELRARVAGHLGVVHPGLDDRIFPPEAAPIDAGPGPSAPAPCWGVGVLTAPRAVPTLGPTLRSLAASGFGPAHIFAEPGSHLPPEVEGHRLEVHGRRLGNFSNFYNALATLYRLDRAADRIAIFQDDIRAAVGLKDWCDAQLWPEGAGIVSLFTPWIHSDRRPGWRRLSPGYSRVFGGQAMVFRRDVVEAFLADPQVLREVRVGRRGEDALVSGWAARRGLEVAYHTPSPVQHVGFVSSIYANGPDPRITADAVDHVDEIPRWTPPPRRPGTVGLIGWSAPTGLGYQNADLARNLGVARWLVPIHPTHHARVAPDVGCRVDYAPLDAPDRTIQGWLRGLDWVLFVERPYLPRCARLARGMSVSVACVPNWEWLHPRADWLNYVDLMLCPTRHTYDLILDWKARYGYGWDAVYVPWPVDVDAFRFRQRLRCDRYVFANGWGGGPTTRLDGTPTPYRRKGIELIAEAARIAPRLRFLVYSQQEGLPKLPANVELRPPPADHRRLYAEGDVCVQPSHYEGLGLQLLECQAAGMPLVTTDAPPMNEQHPWAAIPVAGTEVVRCAHDLPITSQLIDPEALARLLCDRMGADISGASRAARAFIEREHSWGRARATLREALVAL